MARVDVPPAMSTGTTSDRGIAWNGTVPVGAAAGLLGAAVMAAAMAAMGATEVLAGAIPGLYGLAPPPTLPAGVAVHLGHGAALGVIFAGGLAAADVESLRAILGAGLAYGVVTWVVLATLVMPVWLGAVGFPQAPPVPNVAVPSLVWHLVYGAVTGGVVAAVGT